MALISQKDRKAQADANANANATPPAGATLKGNVGKKIEADPTEANSAPAVETVEQPATAAAAPASESRAVAAPRAAEVTLAPTIEMMDFVLACKNRYKVDWNTLDRVQGNNGNFLDMGDGKRSMGSKIQVRLLSWQDSWQVSPGSDSAEAKDYVRYSNDGVETTQGENIREYLNRLQHELGYTKATCDHRTVLVGELVGAEKDSRLVGQLVQMDLPKTSKAEFDKYQINTAFKLGRGLLKQENVEVMTLTADVVSKGDKSWTIVKFEPTL